VVRRIRPAVAVAAFLLCSVACFAASLRQPLGTRSESQPPLQARKGTVIPFEYARRHLFVTLTVNGHPGLVFLVDTGTNADILNLATSEELGIPVEQITRAKDLGLGGGKVSVAGARDVRVQYGSLELAHSLAIVDLDGLAGSFKHRIDGILGYPLLKRFVAQIDLERQELTLWPPGAYTPSGAGDVLRLTNTGNMPAIAVTVNTAARRSETALVSLDTGSDASLMLYPKFAHRSHLDGAFLQMQSKDVYGLGGIFPVRPGLLDSIVMGDVKVTGFTAYLMQTSPALTRHNVSGAIGMMVLGSYRRIIFDVPQDRVIFEAPPPAPPSAEAASSRRPRLP
jgi:hypothetical protein